MIGYDAVSGRDVPFPEDLPVPAQTWRDLTSDPRRYGFHATLKAPFALRACTTLDEAAAHAEGFAARQTPVVLPQLAMRLLGSFVALVPAEASCALNALASDSVEAFEAIRAPLTGTERARRLAAGLTGRQTAHLDRYGYPYVHDEFRFHMTLTGRLAPEISETVRSWLEQRYGASVGPGLMVDAISLFGQESREARFKALERFPFRG